MQTDKGLIRQEGQVSSRLPRMQTRRLNGFVHPTSWRSRHWPDPIFARRRDLTVLHDESFNELSCFHEPRLVSAWYTRCGTMSGLSWYVHRGLCRTIQWDSRCRSLYVVCHVYCLKVYIWRTSSHSSWLIKRGVEHQCKDRGRFLFSRIETGLNKHKGRVSKAEAINKEIKQRAYVWLQPSLPVLWQG